MLRALTITPVLAANAPVLAYAALNLLSKVPLGQVLAGGMLVLLPWMVAATLTFHWL